MTYETLRRVGELFAEESKYRTGSLVLRKSINDHSRVYINIYLISASKNLYISIQINSIIYIYIYTQNLNNILRYIYPVYIIIWKY